MGVDKVSLMIVGGYSMAVREGATSPTPIACGCGTFEIAAAHVRPGRCTTTIG